MRSVIFVVPGRIDACTGGYIYDRRIMAGLGRRGWLVDYREVDASFPFPTQSALAHAAREFSRIPDGTIVVIDGLALGAMPGVVEQEASRLQLVALVHLPLAADVTADPGAVALLERTEGRALAAVALIVVTGSATMPMLARYALSPDRIVVVEPGTDPAPLAHGSREAREARETRETTSLLCVGTIGPGKGHEILLRALARVSARDWRLVCAGSTTRHPATVERVRETARELGLEDRVSLVGELDSEQLALCYASADLFVLATRQETYGMAVAEALAHGLPVVSTTTGAIPDLVGDRAGILVPPGNTALLTAALDKLIGNPLTRASFAEGARGVRDCLPSWDQAAGRMNAALSRLNTHG